MLTIYVLCICDKAAAAVVTLFFLVTFFDSLFKTLTLTLPVSVKQITNKKQMDVNLSTREKEHRIGNIFIFREEKQQHKKGMTTEFVFVDFFFNYTQRINT